MALVATFVICAYGYNGYFLKSLSANCGDT